MKRHPRFASALGLLTLAVTLLGLAAPVVASTIFFRVDRHDTSGPPYPTDPVVDMSMSTVGHFIYRG